MIIDVHTEITNPVMAVKEMRSYEVDHVDFIGGFLIMRGVIDHFGPTKDRFEWIAIPADKIVHVYEVAR